MAVYYCGKCHGGYFSPDDGDARLCPLCKGAEEKRKRQNEISRQLDRSESEYTDRVVREARAEAEARNTDRPANENPAFDKLRQATVIAGAAAMTEIARTLKTVLRGEAIDPDDLETITEQTADAMGILATYNQAATERKAADLVDPGPDAGDLE